MTSKHSYFHELEIKQLFTDEIERIFALDEVVDDLDCNVTIYSEFDDKASNVSLPCILVSLNDVSTHTRGSTFDDNQFATDFTLECDIYSNNLTGYSRQNAVLHIGDILNKYLTDKYNAFEVSSVPLPNIDTNIARRLYRFSGTIDNSQNILY